MHVTTWPISKRGNKWEMLSYEAWMDGRTAVCHNKPVFWRAYKNEWPICYPEITNISSLAKLFFKTFISLKHLSDYRTVGLSDCRTIGLSDYSYGPVLCVCFVDRFLSFCTFSFGHCVVCSSMYGFWLPLWYFRTLLSNNPDNIFLT